MSALYNPSTWLFFVGGVLLFTGFVLMLTTWRNTTHMSQWKKDSLEVRSKVGAYIFGFGAIIAVSGACLLIMSLRWVLILAGLAFLIWGISLQSERNRRQEPIRGHAGYILISIGILTIAAGVGLFFLF